MKWKMNPKSLANLRPIQKGQVLNPKGRIPIKDCLLECIKLELIKASPAPGLTNEQLIASVLVKQATSGETRAIELMMSYLHARPSFENKLSGEVVLRVLRDSSKSRDTDSNA